VLVLGDVEDLVSRCGFCQLIKVVVNRFSEEGKQRELLLRVDDPDAVVIDWETRTFAEVPLSDQTLVLLTYALVCFSS
jgi:hypothetical protein